MRSLYGEIPAGLRWLFYLEAVLVWAATGWLVVLFVRALAERGASRLAGAPGPVPADLLWVFLVPALDEEITIADSVSRLTALALPHRMIVVIDDGSTDGTGRVLAGLRQPGLAVLRRVPPEARQGKAAALNAGWRYLHREVLRSGPYAGWDPARVIVVVVDADGRLHPQTPAAVAGHFTDPRVGGVQTQVRIYNRRTVLTWCQDVEFAIYGRLYQLGRSPWGTAGMGGNGQFNRLTALDSLAGSGAPAGPGAAADSGPAAGSSTGAGSGAAPGSDATAGAGTAGPWWDALTEDQDLGLRLIGQGWRSRHVGTVGVDQQGLNNLRPLLRQRTRWAQGNLQAMRRLGVVRSPGLHLWARFDLAFYLVTPVVQLIISATLVASAAVFLFAGVPWWGGTLWLLFVFYGLTFGSAVLGLICRAPRITALVVLRAVLLSWPYTVYAWLVVPALLGAILRTATAQRSWAKTAREPLPEPRPTG